MSERPKHPVISGSLATMGELLFAYPLEYIKVRCSVHVFGVERAIHAWGRVQTQLQLSAAHLDAPVASAGCRTVNPRSYANSWELIRYTYGRFGAFGFYRGMSSCMLFAFPRGMTRFVTYEACIKELEVFYRVDGVPASSISCVVVYGETLTRPASHVRIRVSCAVAVCRLQPRCWLVLQRASLKAQSVLCP